MYKMNVEVLELIKKLELALKIMVENRITSRYRSVFKGKGIEFEEYRPYGPGDDAKMIDWKASARANQVLVKQFTEERNLDVYFLLDVSSSMVFGSTEKLKSEYAAEFVASLSHFIMQVGDNIGLVMFNDDIAHTLVASGGMGQFYIVMRSLVNPGFYGGAYDLPQAVEFLMKMVKKKGLLFIVSDFVGLKPGWESSIRFASGKFDIVGVKVSDPRDRTLPRGAGQVVISDPFSKKTMLIDPDEVGDEYEEYARMNEEMVKRGFLNNNADFFELNTEEPFIKPIINFFKGREILSFR